MTLKKVQCRRVDVPVGHNSALKNQVLTKKKKIIIIFFFFFLSKLCFLAPSYDLPVRQLYDTVRFSTSFEASINTDNQKEKKKMLLFLFFLVNPEPDPERAGFRVKNPDPELKNPSRDTTNNNHN